jgi:hypothetical protein
MRTTLPLLCLLLTPTDHVVNALRTGKYCFSGCELTLNYLHFNDVGAASEKEASCQSKLRAASLYLCIDGYCGGQGREEWLRGKNETCRQLANTPIPPYSLVAEITPEERAALRRVSADEAFAHPMLGEIVVPDETLFERAFTTLVWRRSSFTGLSNSASRTPLITNMKYTWCTGKHRQLSLIIFC